MLYTISSVYKTEQYSRASRTAIWAGKHISAVAFLGAVFLGG